MHRTTPITWLALVSKIFERVLHKQLYGYLNENELFCPQQFGFKSICSTELAYATSKSSKSDGLYVYTNKHIFRFVKGF